MGCLLCAVLGFLLLFFFISKHFSFSSVPAQSHLVEPVGVKPVDIGSARRSRPCGHPVPAGGGRHPLKEAGGGEPPPTSFHEAGQGTPRQPSFSVSSPARRTLRRSAPSAASPGAAARETLQEGLRRDTPRTQRAGEPRAWHPDYPETPAPVVGMRPQFRSALPAAARVLGDHCSRTPTAGEAARGRGRGRAWPGGRRGRIRFQAAGACLSALPPRRGSAPLLGGGKGEGGERGRAARPAEPLG